MNSRLSIYFILFIAAGIFNRVFRLGDKILWVDEGYDYHYAKLSSVAEIFDKLKEAVLSPLPNIIDHYWIKLFGESIFALHLQSVIWSVMTLLLFAYMCRRLFSERAALVAVAVFSLNPFLPEYAQTMRYFAMAGFFNQLWLTGFLFHTRFGGRKWFFLYIAATAVSLNLHLFNLFAIVAVSVLAVLFYRRLKVNPLLYIAGHALAVATLLPRYFLMKQTGAAGIVQAIPLKDALGHLAQIPVGGLVRTFFTLCAGKIVTIDDMPFAAAFLIMLPFALLCLAALVRKRDRIEAWCCTFILGSSVLQAWLSMIFTGSHMSRRYFAPFFALFAVVLGLGADYIREKKPAAAHIMLAAYIILSYSVLGVYWTRLDRPENVRTVMERVKKEARPGDFFNLSPPYFFFMEYYWKDYMPLHDFSDDFDLSTTPHSNLLLVRRENLQLDDAKMLRWHEELASGFERVWVFWIFGTRNTEDDSRFACRWLEANYERLETIPFRMFPYSNETTGELVLYRAGGKNGIFPAEPEDTPKCVDNVSHLTNY